MKRQCNGNVDECFECGKYYASFSAHFEKEKNKLREVITIYCCYGWPEEHYHRNRRTIEKKSAILSDIPDLRAR